MPNVLTTDSVIWHAGMGQRLELTFGEDIAPGVDVMANEFDRELKQLVRCDIAENCAGHRLFLVRRFDGVSLDMAPVLSRQRSSQKARQRLPSQHWIKRLWDRR